MNFNLFRLFSKNKLLKQINYLEKKESKRQKNTLSLIASENCAFPEVLKISASVLTNKYAEGYPGKRYYAGCKYVDQIEKIAIEEACKLFSCSFANVQPSSGSSALFAIYKAFLNPGDLIMGMDLASGGHLTHSSKVSYVSYIWKTITYSVDPYTQELDYEKIEQLAIETKPKLIVAGCSSYSRKIDFHMFRKIADKVGAILIGDISHLSAFITTGLHQECFPHCDAAITTTHKHLRGPRGAIILWVNSEYRQKINKAVFPGTHGGPQPNLIAAKAVCLAKCNNYLFKEYSKQVLENASAMCNYFSDAGCHIVSQKTDIGLFVINVLKTFGITGDVAQDWLEKANIITNKNLIVDDTNALQPSGIRIGTFWATSINLKKEECLKIAAFIYEIFNSKGNKSVISNVKKEILLILKKAKEFQVKKLKESN